MKLTIQATLAALVFSICPYAHSSIRVAVTVDDLPSHSSLPNGVTRLEVATKMLAVLKKHNVPEVYGFINAAKLKDHPEEAEVFKKWIEAGYPLGNHTFSHPDLTKTAAAEFENEIQKNESVLNQMNAGMDWHYFRYPFLREGESLEKRLAIRNYLAAHRYKIAQVTIDFEDWSWNAPYAACVNARDTNSINWLKKTYLQNAVEQLDRAEIITSHLYKRPVAHILLLHVGAFDTEMLDELLLAYEKRGVVFIPLSEAVKDDIYSFDPAVALNSGTEFTYQVMKARGVTLKDIGLAHYKNYPEAQLKTICR